jgi:predicted DNA binding CopG/RHH family protein
MKKTRPTEDQKKQLAALDAIEDADIDLSDIPDQSNTSAWVRASMYRPLMRAISIRLPVPDIALARDLAARKGLPYQTYIKQLLHDALSRERPGR